jgi:hypothetical protein
MDAKGADEVNLGSHSIPGGEETFHHLCSAAGIDASRPHTVAFAHHGHLRLLSCAPPINHPRSPVFFSQAFHFLAIQ